MMCVQIITITVTNDETTSLDALCDAYAGTCVAIQELLGQVWHANARTRTVSGALRWPNRVAAMRGGAMACAAVMRHDPVHLPVHSRIVSEMIVPHDPPVASPRARPAGLVEYPDGYDLRG